MKAMFCDMYNFQITGDVSANLNAASCDSPTHSGPSLLILNDQGGSIMDVSEDVTMTLRAEEHGHQPIVCLNFQGSKSNNVVSEDGTVYSLNAMHGHDVHVVCFEPGIAKREGSTSRFVHDKCGTLRADMGDNQPAVAYAIDHVVTTGGNCTAQGPCYYKDICPTEKASGVHAVCYEVKDG